MSVTPPCIMFMYQREKYETCCEFLLSKTNQSEWTTRLTTWQTLEYLHNTSLFKTKDLSCVCVNYVSEENCSHLFRDFSIQQQIPVAATVQVEINNSRIKKNVEFQILMVLPNRSPIRKIKNISKSQIMWFGLPRNQRLWMEFCQIKK
jgi:hypothetical protein